MSRPTNIYPPSNFTTTFLSIVSAETGVPPSEIESNVPFTDLGIDSPFSLLILATIFEQTGHKLPSTFFRDNPTFADAQKALSAPPETKDILEVSKFACTSVLLQGKSDSDLNLPPLFLLPDGSGSAGSYIRLPTLKSGIQVFGLNSPFLNCPSQFHLSLPEAANLYVQEILRIHPRGPCILGGWSIGGVYAYEATRILREMGREVKGLILIDAPCPGSVPPLPQETADLLDRLGVFGQVPKVRSEKLKGSGRDTRVHFRGSIESLRSYHPVSMGEGIRCVALYAKQGVWESVEENERNALMGSLGDEVKGNEAHKWMMDERIGFGDGGTGWEGLIMGLRVEEVEGNHFSCMRPPLIENVARAIDRCIKEFI